MFRTNRPASALARDDTYDNDNIAATCRQEAALRQSNRKLANHHPSVKLPPRLEDKSREEQIRRCCDRFKGYPSTVETLARAVQTILSHPLERKFRRIEKSNAGYQRSLARVPGAEHLLNALNFVPIDSQTLFLHKVDKKLLQFALRTLQATKATPEYQQAKMEEEFAKEIKADINSVPTSDELTERQLLLSKIPKEPAQGRSAVMMINFSDTTTLTRRFDGDDTLQDVLNWLGGTVGATVYEKIVHTRQWCLVDVNRQGNVPLDCSSTNSTGKTLQHLGFWPSGRLSIRPSLPEWREGSSATMMKDMGASRGLGSAPSETLQY